MEQIGNYLIIIVIMLLLFLFGAGISNGANQSLTFCGIEENGECIKEVPYRNEVQYIISNQK